MVVPHDDINLEEYVEKNLGFVSKLAIL